MIAGIMEIVAEAHVLAERSGIESLILENLIQQNFGALAYSDSLRMTQGVYCPGRGKFRGHFKTNHALTFCDQVSHLTPVSTSLSRMWGMVFPLLGMLVSHSGWENWS